MNSQPIAGRAVFNSVLASLLAMTMFVAGCVPPKKKMPKGEDVTSAPAAPASAAAAPGNNPLSRTWQHLVALEGKSGGFGSIAITNAVAQKREEVSSATNIRLIEVSLDVTGQLRKPFVEAVMNLDVSQARITGVEVSGAEEINPGEAAAATFSNKGRGGWRMQLADGQAPRVNQKLRLHIEAPKSMESVEIRIQRSFKKANGDMFNSSQAMPDSLEAQRLLETIQKELSRRAKGAGGDIPWSAVGDCASVKGEEKNGQCYPTDDSWRLAEKRAAVLCGTPWQEKLTLLVSGVAVALKKQEAVGQPVEAPKPPVVTKPVEAPKPVEEAKPVETPKPAEEAQPVETPKPVEETKPVEAPKPAVVAKPVSAPKPEAAAKPKPAAVPKVQQEPSKKPAAKAVPKKAKVNDSGQPVYDLSDVLGKQ